jgi:hypothetical protein
MRAETGDSPAALPWCLTGKIRPAGDISLDKVLRKGGSLVQGETIGGSWVEGGSPRRAIDGGKLSARWELDDGADQRSPAVAFESQGNGVPQGSW